MQRSPNIALQRTPSASPPSPLSRQPSGMSAKRAANRITPNLLILACFAALPVPTAAQTPRVELDHVFVVVQPGAMAESAALRSAGFKVGSKTAKHVGQGTASVAVLFENAYLELIWVDSAVSVEPEHVATAQWFRDAAAWRTSGQSPFGLGLRRLPGDTAALPVPVQRESAAWLEPGAVYELLHQPADSLAADFFVVPAVSSLPSWIMRVRERTPELLQHPGGDHEITRLRVSGPRGQQPAAFRVLRPKPVEMIRAPKPLLELYLDNGVRRQRVDLRPILPLVVVR
ncbi:MAG: VOC family protein [Acidobacteriota bacterium]